MKAMETLACALPAMKIVASDARSIVESVVVAGASCQRAFERLEDWLCVKGASTVLREEVADCHFLTRLMWGETATTQLEEKQTPR